MRLLFVDAKKYVNKQYVHALFLLRYVLCVVVYIVNVKKGNWTMLVA